MARTYLCKCNLVVHKLGLVALAMALIVSLLVWLAFWLPETFIKQLQ